LFSGLSQAAAEDIVRRETLAGYMASTVDPEEVYLRTFHRSFAAVLLEALADNRDVYEFHDDEDDESSFIDLTDFQCDLREFLGSRPVEFRRVGEWDNRSTNLEGESTSSNARRLYARTEWVVVLNSGETVLVYADSYTEREEAGRLVFYVLINRAPGGREVVARFDLDKVKDFTVTHGGSK